MQTTTLFSLVLVLISHVMSWWEEDRSAEAAALAPASEVADAEDAGPAEQKASATLTGTPSGCPEQEEPTAQAL